jgi:hypothetical protein
MPAVLTLATGNDSLDQSSASASADFDRVRKLIYQHAGISLHDGKQAMVYSRLSRRLRETGQSFGELPAVAGKRQRPATSGRSSSTASRPT